MAGLPSYEESTSVYGTHTRDAKADSESTQHFSIREEIGASRSLHVAALVSKLLPQVRARARQGLSKTTLLVLPSDQDSSRKGQLVGFPDDELPILIQLEGRHDTLEFWTQKEAVLLLQDQLLAAMSDGVPVRSVCRPLPPRDSLPTKDAFLGRKQGKVPAPKEEPQAVVAPPVIVEVQLDEISFRSENEYGLYTTIRGRGVVVTMHIK